ncbi:MAG: L-asparaginase, partial [uncultured Acetobacteraceae bacterium]
RRQHVPVRSDAMPPVEIVAMYGGADGQLVRAAVEQGARGVVVQALGMGNMNQPMFAAIKDAIGRGVPVVSAPRAPPAGRPPRRRGRPRAPRRPPAPLSGDDEDGRRVPQQSAPPEPPASAPRPVPRRRTFLAGLASTGVFAMVTAADAQNVDRRGLSTPIGVERL